MKGAAAAFPQLLGWRRRTLPVGEIEAGRPRQPMIGGNLAELAHRTVGIGSVTHPHQPVLAGSIDPRPEAEKDHSVAGQTTVELDARIAIVLPGLMPALVARIIHVETAAAGIAERHPVLAD